MLASSRLGVGESEGFAAFLQFYIGVAHHDAMVTLTENGSERAEPGACAVGDWVKALNLPRWKIGMQEFFPDGMPEDDMPWFFGPVFNGPNLLGWQRLE